MIKSITIDQPRLESKPGLLALIATPAALTAIGLATAWLYHWGGYLHRFSQGISSYIALFILQFALYLLACYFVFRFRPQASRPVILVTAGIIVLLAGVFRAELAGKPPYLSTDAYRYVWDGNVQAHHINPYRYKPTAENIAYLRDDRIFPKINGADYAVTPYPPVAQIIYLLVDVISPLNITAFKVAVLVFDMIAVLAIMLILARAGTDPARAVLFAWHPLIIWEGSHSGHVDSVFIAFLSLALLAWSYKRYFMTGIALGAATLIKFYPIILLPVFLPGLSIEFASLRERSRSGLVTLKESAAGLWSALWTAPGRRIILGLIAVIVLCYTPYLTVGRGIFGYLSEFFEEEGYINGGGRYFLLALGRKLLPIPTTLYTCIAALSLFALCTVWLMRNKRNVIDVARGSIAIIGLYLFLTTPRYPWYYCWIVPFLCFIPRLGWIYLTGATVLLYTLWFIPNEYPNLPIWLGAAMYVPTLTMLALDHYRKSGHRFERADQDETLPI